MTEHALMFGVCILAVLNATWGGYCAGRIVAGQYYLARLDTYHEDMSRICRKHMNRMRDVALTCEMEVRCDRFVRN